MASSSTNHEVPPILRLPAELLLHILGFILYPDNTIDITDSHIASDANRRCSNNGTEKAGDYSQAHPKARALASSMLVCKEFYICIGKTYWTENRFSIRHTDDLVRLSHSAHFQSAKDHIRHLTFGEGHWTSEDSGLLESPNGTWPPPMQHLGIFNRLKHLELYVGNLADKGSKALVPIITDFASIRRLMPAWMVGWSKKDCPPPYTLCYYRDQMLKDIPERVFDGLKSLKMHFHLDCKRNGRTNKWLTREVLQYTKELRAGAWMPSPHDEGLLMCGGHPPVEDPDLRAESLGGDVDVFRAWLEARAAEYWDDEVDMPGCPHRGGNHLVRLPRRENLQWCAWARERAVPEWRYWSRPGARPKTYNEIFGKK